MHFQLNPHISFCFVEDRPVFLDRAADRYFMLSGKAECGFVKLVEGHDPSVSEMEALGDLAARGILHDGQGNLPPSPCRLPIDANKDADDLAVAGGSIIKATVASVRMAVIRHRLKQVGLDRLLCDFENAKRRMVHCSSKPLSDIIGVSSAFRRANLITKSRDRCLTRSIAIASTLLKDGISCNIVIGVQLGPFQAHCWVQHGEYIVGDRMGYVGEFTPIIVL